MTKTVYAIKLNQNLKKYLTFANTKTNPAIASQEKFDLCVLFDSTEEAEKAIEAYLSHPQCKMSIENRKFITIDPIEISFETDRFPFTNRYNIVDTNLLVDKDNSVFSRVFIDYNGFRSYGYICSRAYSNL